MHIVEQIVTLPQDWHPLGGFDSRTAAAIVKHCKGRRIQNSAETGAGKSTLLFSHLSERHTVFAINEGDSLKMPMESPLLKQGVVTVVEGPTQTTLPTHSFPRLQLALIDGPHAWPFPEMEYYYLYPHLDAGALLLLDDIDIPTINNMFRVLKADAMFRLLEVVGNTAFFERTKAPTFDPLTGWFAMQGYNARMRVIDHSPSAYAARMRHAVAVALPSPLRRAIRSLVPRAQ
jgi:hypothetical protein